MVSHIGLPIATALIASGHGSNPYENHDAWAPPEARPATGLASASKEKAREVFSTTRDALRRAQDAAASSQIVYVLASCFPLSLGSATEPQCVLHSTVLPSRCSVQTMATLQFAATALIN